MSLENYAQTFVRTALSTRADYDVETIQKMAQSHLRRKVDSGEIKASKKDFARVNAYIVENYRVLAPQYRAMYLPTNSPTVEATNTKLNSKVASKTYKKQNTQKAGHHYFEFNSMSKKGRQNLHKRNMADAKAAFGTDEYLKYLREHNPELYKETTQQSVQTQSIQQEEYISAKKKKQLKKQAEINSATEHQKARRVNTKLHRNAKYTTTQNQMTEEAKQAYLSAQKASEAFVAQTSTVKSAEESMNFFIEKGLANIETTASSQTTTIPTGNTTTTPKTGTSTTPKPKSNTISDVVENVSNASKKTPNGKAGKIWAAVGIAGAALAGIFGYKTFNDNQANKLDTAA